MVLPLRSIAANWYRYDSVPTYIMSLLVFTAFLNVDIKGEVIKKMITLFAPATFGVYLIHAHADFSPWSWEVLALPEKMGNLWFPGVQIMTVLSIFLICGLLDIARKNAVGKVENTLFLREICAKIQKQFMQGFDDNK